MKEPRWTQSLRDRLKGIVSRYARVSPVIDPSDIVNSAIVTAYRKRDQFRGNSEEEFHAWLRTIVQNKYFSRTRSESAQRRGSAQRVELGPHTRLDAPSTEKAPDQVAEDHEAEKLLKKVLERIGHEHAELLYLVNYCDMSHSDIAIKTGLTKNQVTGRLRTANKRMEEAIRELGLDDLDL